MATSQRAILKNAERIGLLISPEEQDYEILADMFRQEGWTLRVASSLDSASAHLACGVPTVVITERDLATGSWKDVLDWIQGLPHAPLVIVISRLADCQLWSEALNLGAYDVLAKPLNQSEVLRVLNSAWVHQKQAHPATVRVLDDPVEGQS
jgi:two-component system, NtrC family, nitrogen regulation response regulator NtrX